MNYKIDKDLLTSDQVLFFQNLEMELRSLLRTSLGGNLTSKMRFEIVQSDGRFITYKDNAGFDMNGSLHVSGIVSTFLNGKNDVDFENCSLHVEVMFAEAKSAEKRKDDGLPTFLPVTPRYSFEQIILPEATLKTIQNDLNTIKFQELIYKDWGFEEVDSCPKSVLNFYGPPGTGKTMCAHAIAKFLNKPLLALNYSEIESKYVGDAAKNLKKAFDTARSLGAVMFFDESDSFLGKRIENVSQGSDQALNSLRSQMLILLEEFEGVVLFATNLVTNFDKAFESRILDHIRFELPNQEARAAIIAKMIPSRLPVDHQFSHEEMMQASELIDGFSGREIKSAVQSMLLSKASEYGADAIFTFKDLTDALTAKKQSIDALKAEEAARRKAKIAKRLTEKFEQEDAEAKAVAEREKNKEE